MPNATINRCGGVDQKELVKNHYAFDCKFHWVFKTVDFGGKRLDQHRSTSFNCGAALNKEKCYWMNLLNMFSRFDFVRVCVYADCLTQVKTVELIKPPKLKERQHAASLFEANSRAT